MAVISKTFSGDQYTAIYLVDEVHEGMRLDQYMQIYLQSFSRQMVKKKIKDGDITIKGRPGKPRPSSMIHYKEHITMITKKDDHEDEYWNGALLELTTTPDIIFENHELLVISKPPYMATHPTGKHLFNCATVFFECRDNKTIHSIHRLDRETSGILLLGKNPKCANQLTEKFEESLVKKCYFFISKLAPEFPQDQDNDFLIKRRLGATEAGLKRVYINNFPEDSIEGKHAETTISILHIENNHALCLAFPKTGRQHQIRVHAQTVGLPLVGDKLYLGNFKMFQRFKDNIATDDDHRLMQISRHALHAIALKIPYNNKDSIFRSTIPNDLKSWISENMQFELKALEEKIKEKIEIYFKQSNK